MFEDASVRPMGDGTGLFEPVLQGKIPWLLLASQKNDPSSLQR